MASKLGEYRGYTVYITTSGGKAGTGRNLTSSIQVRDTSGTRLLKNFRFATWDSEKRMAAMHKAKRWVDQTINDTYRKA